MLVAGGLFVAILLGLSSELRRPHVNFISVLGGVESAEQAGQQVRIGFNRPINWDNQNELITINPEVDHSLYSAGDTLVVVMNEVLQPQSDYTITISDQLQDVYGKKIEDKYDVSFSTKSRSLAFIVRDESGDRIVKSNDSLQNLEDLYTADTITRFEINDDWLAVVSAFDTGATELIIVDRATGREKRLESSGESRISALDISEELGKIMYTAQPVEIAGEIAIAQGPHIIKTYDFNTGETEVFETGLGEQDYIEVRFTSDGLGLIVRAGDGTYYLFDFNNTDVNVSLGKHIAVSNFSKDGDKVMFMDQPIGQVYSAYPTVVIADEDRNLTDVTTSGEFWIDLRFMNTSDNVLYAEQYAELAGAKGIFRIFKYNPQTKESEFLLQDEEQRSLELPIPSPDDELLVIERYTEADQLNYEGLRNMEFQTKPANADLIIYNMGSGKIIDPGIRGVSAVWI